MQGAADGLRNRVNDFFGAFVAGADVVRWQVQGVAEAFGQLLADVLSACFAPCPEMARATACAVCMASVWLWVRAVTVSDQPMASASVLASRPSGAIRMAAP